MKENKNCIIRYGNKTDKESVGFKTYRKDMELFL